MRTRDPGWKKFGSEIRDEHSGSTTLFFIVNFGHLNQSAEELLKKHLLSWAHLLVKPGNFFLKSNMGKTLKHFPHCLEDTFCLFSFTFLYIYLVSLAVGIYN
jgi:hypothetical protein